MTALLAIMASIATAAVCADEVRPFPITVHLSVDPSITFLGAVPPFELARALGRVLAHEIGHVLLRLPLHDATGLMRAVLSPSELAEPNRSRLGLANRSVGRLRSRLAALAQVDGD